jgi:hypothetical protein
LNLITGQGGLRRRRRRGRRGRRRRLYYWFRDGNLLRSRVFNRKLCGNGDFLRSGFFFRWRSRSHLFFNLCLLSDHELSLFTSHGEDLELFGCAFFASAGFITTIIGLGHFNLREYYFY